MEHSPSKSEDDDDKKTTGKKKRAGALGTFAVDPSSAKQAPSEADSIWDKLTLTKRQSGETKAVVPLSQIVNQEAAGRMPEADEIEAPLETLSQPERQFAEREIIAGQPEAAGGKPAEAGPETAGAEVAATAAVERFRDKILADGQTAEQAFAETLQELGQPTGEPGSEPGPDMEVPGGPAPRLEATRDTALPEQSTAATSSGETSDQTAPYPMTTGSTPPPLGNRFTRSGGEYDTPPPLSGTAAPRAEKEYVPYYNSGDVMGAVLIGGIVGYLIGRRRGRIKTERKLRPIQKKLEKQVADLRENIVAKEYHIRKVAREGARERQHMNKLEAAGTSDSKRIEALEANQLHGKQVAPEQIGRVLVTAEEKPAPPAAERPEKSSQRPVTDKRVATMSRAELLELSEKVAVENTNLRQVYETHLVSEQGLRRLVGEYTRGGDVQKALRQELVEHEIDFERDPILRDRQRASAASAAGDTLGSLLRKAEVLNEAETKDELAVLKARQAHHENQRQSQQSHRRVIDISMVAAILILFVLVMMLLLRGR